MKLERRQVSIAPECRADDGLFPTVRGYAAVYATEAVIGGMWRELIAPGAFRSVLSPTMDVRALFNHDDNCVLGRTTNGTLRLSEDERGLAYEFDPNPEDTDAARVVAKIKRGDVSQSSYGFRVKTDEWTKATRAGELPLRTITEFAELRDVSPVTFPAFEETTVEARGAAAAHRAAAVPVDTSDELAELITYDAMRTMLTQVAVTVGQATTLVDALMAMEKGGTQTPDDEEAECDIEEARLGVLAVLTQQMCSALYGVQSFVQDRLREMDEEDEEPVIVNVDVWRARVDLIEME